MAKRREAYHAKTWSSGRNESRIVFGKKYDEAQLKATFMTAYNSGFYLWDTAEVYGMGNAEKLLGQCMKNHTNVLISTKFHPEKRKRNGDVINGIVRSYYLDIEGNDITKFFSIEGNVIMNEGLLGYEQSISSLEALEKRIRLLILRSVNRGDVLTLFISEVEIVISSI